MKAKSRRIGREKPVEKAPEFDIHWLPPEKVSTDVSNWHVWWTRDKKYRVVRSLSKYDPEDRFFVSCWVDENGNIQILNKFRSLERALIDCRLKYVETHNIADEDISDNIHSTLKYAEEHDLDILPQVKVTERPAPQHRENKVSENGQPSRGNRFTLIGHSVTAVLRWMGKNNWEEEDARNVLKKNGIVVAESTLKSQLHGGKVGRRGDPARLTEKEKNQLLAMKG